MKNTISYSGLIRDLFFGAVRAFLIGMIFAFASGSPLIGEAVACLSFALMLIMPRQLVAGITANFAGSDLAIAQMKLNDAFNMAEMRSIQPQTFAKFVDGNQNVSTPDIKVARTREDRALAQYFLSRTSQALTTGRDHQPTGVTSTSNVLTPSFTTWSRKFSISMKQADTNIYSFEEMMGHEIVNAFKDFNTSNESQATSYLLNNRSAYNAAVAEGLFNTTTTTYEISETAVGNRAWEITESMMAENLYGGMALTIFCDTISYNKIRMFAAQGATNATNTSFQFSGMTFIRSLDLTASAQALGYTKGYWIATADANIAVYDWIPKQNIDGVEQSYMKYGNIVNPVDGLRYAIYSWYQPYNSTSIGGYTQDIWYNYELSIDLAFESAPLDRNAGETVLFAAALV